jgi:hypothetical protein
MDFIYNRALKVVAWLGIDYQKPRINPFSHMSNIWKTGKTQILAAALTGDAILETSLEPDHDD